MGLGSGICEKNAAARRRLRVFDPLLIERTCLASLLSSPPCFSSPLLSYPLCSIHPSLLVLLLLHHLNPLRFDWLWNFEVDLEFIFSFEKRPYLKLFNSGCSNGPSGGSKAGLQEEHRRRHGCMWRASTSGEWVDDGVTPSSPFQVNRSSSPGTDSYNSERDLK
jgi:hypothetical protein